MGKVLNVRDERLPSNNEVFIGRPSKWGNPFTIGKDGTRAEVILKFSDYLQRSDLILDLPELESKDLVCFCAPLPCHGDILLLALEQYYGVEEDEK